MDVREAAQEYGDILCGTYDIGFVNADGMEDETEFTVDDLPDLENCFSTFCKENKVDENNVLYVSRADDLTAKDLFQEDDF